MTNPRFLCLTAIAASSILLGGCGSGTVGSDDEVSVLASSYPFAYVAEHVAGDHARVENLTRPGVEPHDLELRPKQVVAVQGADLLIFSAGFQPAVDDAEQQSGLPKKNVLDIATVTNVHGSDAQDSQDHGAVDSHTWLNPLNQAAVAGAIAAKLVAIDPANAADYEANAAALAAELTALDDEFTKVLAKCQTRSIVTSHAAFGYLADRYDLHQIAIAGLDPSSEPSLAQLAAVTDLVRKEKVSTIFTEQLASPAIAKTVAAETGAALATLDPIEGLSEQTAGEDYLSLMRQNLNAIAQANRCS